MKVFCTIALLLGAGIMLAACGQTQVNSPAATAAPTANSVPLGNTGIRVSGYAESGATAVTH